MSLQSAAAMWNERYAMPDYAYGKAPNEYLKQCLPEWPIGKILFPAEGEGRNAVFAAALGWQVSAFDISEAGQLKAFQFAKEKQVKIDYQVGHFPELGYHPQSFDAVGLIYAHFPPSIRSEFYILIDQLLKPGGWVVFEAFSNNHSEYVLKNPKVGGPKDISMLYNQDDLTRYFPDYEIIELSEQEVCLNEGLFHVGLGSVIRFRGRKPLKQGS
jgi:hypothetical protein